MVRLYSIILLLLTCSAFGAAPILRNTLTTNAVPLGLVTQVLFGGGAGGGAPTWGVPAGGGTVTHTAGALMLDLPVFGNGGDDLKVGTKTGTGTVGVMQTSPTLVTPTLGVATATSINGLTLTASSGVLTIAAGKTFTINNTLTLTGTDGSSIAFGAGGTVVYQTRTLTLSGTANQITLTAGAQDLSADRTWGLSFPTTLIAPGSFTSTGAITNSTAAAGQFVSTVTGGGYTNTLNGFTLTNLNGTNVVGTLTNNTTGNAATATLATTATTANAGDSATGFFPSGTLELGLFPNTVTTNNANLLTTHLMAGDGARGVTNVTVGSGLTLAAGTLSASGGGGSQTPWASAIDGGGFALTNAGSITSSNMTNVQLTAGRALVSGTGGLITNSTVTTAELGLLSGAQAVGYTLACQASTAFNPVDATVYYVAFFNTADVNAGRYSVVIPRTGTIKAWSYSIRMATVGTTEDVVMIGLLNGATTVGTATIDWDVSPKRGVVSGLSQAVTEGDYLEIRITSPTWATNPATVTCSFWFYIE